MKVIMDEVRALYTVAILLRNGAQRVLGYRRFVDASQAHERLERARAQYLHEPMLAAVADVGTGGKPVTSVKGNGPDIHGQIFRGKDDFRNVFCIDVAEVVLTCLNDVSEGHLLAAELEYLALRGQLHRNHLITSDVELKIAMGGGRVQMAPGHG